MKKLAGMVDKANAWAEEAEALITSSEVITLDKAKEIIDKGDELNIVCQEYRTLRNALRQARGWALRVKKLNNDESQAPINEVKELIAEHNQFLVKIPEQIEQLKEMLCGYCLCRRPYDGFMVGCDSCEEWYHGPCVGLTEQQAEKCDKYVCIRCSALKQYEMCADKTLSVIKKWTSPKELQKARTSENQRHQRKIREKKRDQEKLVSTIDKVTKELKELGWDEDAKGETAPTPAVSVPPAPAADPAAFAAAADAAFAAAAAPMGANAVDGALQVAVEGVMPAGADANAYAPPVAAANALVTEAPSQAQDLAAPVAPAPVAPAQGVATASPAIKELRGKLEKAKESLKSGERRLEHLKKVSQDIKNKETREDSLKGFLRHWCILVRLSVLIPSTKEEAKSARPQVNGCISLPMVAMSQEATKLGISELRDVKELMNALSGMSWTLRVLSILSKKPSNNDIKQCVDLYEKGTFRLPEEKCVRMIKSIMYRAKQWQERATRALRPLPGETMPYDKSYLERLLIETKDIPFSFPEEARLINTIEDKGARHCLCGGPSDGSFMISCDSCDKWYHAVCVKFDSDKEGEDSKWICPPCTTKAAEADAAAAAADAAAAAAADSTIDAAALTGHATRSTAIGSEIGASISSSSAGDKKTEKSKEHPPKPKADEWSFDDELSPHAPNPDTLWPPFGLLPTKKALKALGVSNVSEVPTLQPEVLRGVVQGSSYLKATARALPQQPEVASAPAPQAAPTAAATSNTDAAIDPPLVAHVAAVDNANAPSAPTPPIQPAVAPAVEQPALALNSFNAEAVLQHQLLQQQQQQLQLQQQQLEHQLQQQQLLAAAGMTTGALPLAMDTAQLPIHLLGNSNNASPAVPMQVQLASDTVASALLSLVGNHGTLPAAQQMQMPTAVAPTVLQGSLPMQVEQQLPVAAQAPQVAQPQQQLGITAPAVGQAAAPPATPSDTVQDASMAAGTETSPPEGTAEVDDIDEALLSPRPQPPGEPEPMDISNTADAPAAAAALAPEIPMDIEESALAPSASAVSGDQNPEEATNDGDDEVIII